MAYEPKPGSFSLFKNDKEGNDKRPDYRGDGLDLDGNPIKVSAWLKEGAKGKFLSCKIEAKEERQAPAKQAPKPSADFDADVPF